MGDTEQSADATRRVRAVLHSAYALIRSVEANQAIQPLTLDHLIKEHLDRLKKGSTRQITDRNGVRYGERPSRWEQLDKLESSLNAAIKELRTSGDPDAVKEETTQDGASQNVLESVHIDLTNEE